MMVPAGTFIPQYLAIYFTLTFDQGSITWPRKQSVQSILLPPRLKSHCSGSFLYTGAHSWCQWGAGAQLLRRTSSNYLTHNWGREGKLNGLTIHHQRHHVALFLLWNGVGKNDSVISRISFTHFHNSQHMPHFNCVIRLNGSSIFIPMGEKIPGISPIWGFAFMWHKALHLFPVVTILFLEEGNQGTWQGLWHVPQRWLPPRIPCHYRKQQKAFLEENKDNFFLIDGNFLDVAISKKSFEWTVKSCGSESLWFPHSYRSHSSFPLTPGLQHLSLPQSALQVHWALQSHSVQASASLWSFLWAPQEPLGTPSPRSLHTLHITPCTPGLSPQTSSVDTSSRPLPSS